MTQAELIRLIQSGDYDALNAAADEMYVTSWMIVARSGQFVAWCDGPRAGVEVYESERHAQGNFISAVQDSLETWVREDMLLPRELGRE